MPRPRSARGRGGRRLPSCSLTPLTPHRCQMPRIAPGIRLVPHSPCRKGRDGPPPPLRSLPPFLAALPLCAPMSPCPSLRSAGAALPQRCSSSATPRTPLGRRCSGAAVQAPLLGRRTSGAAPRAPLLGRRSSGAAPRAPPLLGRCSSSAAPQAPLLTCFAPLPRRRYSRCWVVAPAPLLGRKAPGRPPCPSKCWLVKPKSTARRRLGQANQQQPRTS